MCLSKWIENGNKSCPLCRKEIELNLSRNESNNFWSFGFRLESKKNKLIFSKFDFFLVAKFFTENNKNRRRSNYRRLNKSK